MKDSVTTESQSDKSASEGNHKMKSSKMNGGDGEKHTTIVKNDSAVAKNVSARRNPSQDQDSAE